MAERKKISKTTRFEIFKRDKFTCQYCGRSSPEVILEVDHIIPVSKGGTNDIMNLITSCKDCNRGKSDKELSDNSTVKKQQKQINDLAEKNEQLEMMLKWRDGLKDIRENEIDSFGKAIAEFCDSQFSLNENGRNKVRRWLCDYSILELLDALDVALLQYYDGTQKSVEIAFSKVTSIAYYKRNPMDESQKKIFYLRKIIINRFSYINKSKAYLLIKTALENGTDFNEIKRICSTCRNWTEFQAEMEELQ